MGKYDAAPTVAAGLIRLARMKAGLTQSDLAEVADVSQQLISAYETGRREPTLPTLLGLLAAAGFELRMILEKASDHDESLQRYLDNLSPEDRAAIERQQADRTEKARLTRVRGR